jgi:predicted TIM-barrel fold metal-dependent hydrolase
MFRAHGNVYGDTAFLPAERYRRIVEAGFAERLIPGTDFPITHYFNGKPDVSPEKQYREDLAQLDSMIKNSKSNIFSRAGA